jgi:hypothetical protein
MYRVQTRSNVEKVLRIVGALLVWLCAGAIALAAALELKWWAYAIITVLLAWPVFAAGVWLIDPEVFKRKPSRG